MTGGAQLTSDAESVARGFSRAADALADTKPVNQRAGAIITAAPAPRGATGQLGASVHATITPGDVTVAGGTRYWTFVHWGAPRHHVRPQPWLLDQLETEQAQLEQLYIDHAQRALGLI